MHLISSNINANIAGTTSRNGIPRPVRYAVFLCLQSATNRFMAFVGLCPDIRQVASAICANKGSRFLAVVAANTRHPALVRRVLACFNHEIGATTL